MDSDDEPYGMDELNDEQRAALNELVTYARQLNICEDVTVDGDVFEIREDGTRVLKPKPPSESECKQKYYKYLIVIDFEATCWENKRKPKNEIIEFPAVLVDVNAGLIVSEFRQFVVPTEEPQLSEFCTNLTGITQSTVERFGVSIRACLKLFDIWLDEMVEKHGLILPKTNESNLRGNCAFATWSDWDLSVCLTAECNRKKLDKPTYFETWIDIKKPYIVCYMYTPKNFGDALQNAKIEFEGRPHSGIDDARNIAQLAYRMAVNGIQYEITTDMRPHIVLHRND